MDILEQLKEWFGERTEVEYSEAFGYLSQNGLDPDDIDYYLSQFTAAGQMFSRRKHIGPDGTVSDRIIRKNKLVKLPNNQNPNN